MQKPIGEFFRRPFVRNVAIVASGTAGAQVITMGFSPIITRLYGPEAFGVLGTFMALVALVTPLAALSYPIAIVLQRDDGDALGVVQLSLRISIFTAGVTGIVLYGFGDSILDLLNLQAISDFIFLIPLVMFFSVCLLVLNQWVIRKKLFKLKAKVALIQALLLNGAKTAIGFFSATAAVLITAAAFGSALHALMLVTGVRKSHVSITTDGMAPTPLLTLAGRHSDFPLYRTPQDFINAASQGLPVIILASLFGAGAAGFYALARTVLALPSSLIAQSVSEVFYPRVAEASQHGESQHRLISRATLGLAAVGIVPFATVFIAGPLLFSFVFGPDWGAAGEYARWLSIMLFFNFINRPSVAAVPVLGIQRGLVIYEVLSTGAKLLALYLGFIVFGSDRVAVALFSIFGAVAYIALIAWVRGVARNFDAGAEYG